MKTHDLIEQLSQEAVFKQNIRTPAWWAVRLMCILFLYAFGAQFFLGVRPDIALQLTRPFFAFEIILLAGITVSAALSCVFVMFPDMYQTQGILKAPYLFFAALMLLLSYQLVFWADDIRMVIPPRGGHAMECALCIAAVALIPSALIFALLRKGASVTPLHAGFFAVLTATGIGCLTLRIAEANDSLVHLVLWHYLPTLIFASCGAVLAKSLLKW